MLQTGRTWAAPPVEHHDHYEARVEGVLFWSTVEAFDWNCPKHITPRFTVEEIDKLVAAASRKDRRARGTPEGGERYFNDWDAGVSDSSGKFPR